MVEVAAELKRRDEALALVNWLLVNDVENLITGLSDSVIDQGVRDRLDPVRHRFSPLEGAGVKVSTAGDTTLFTPATGKAVRVVWIGYFTKPVDDVAAVEVYVEMGASRRFYVPMSFPFAFAHGTVWQGAVNEPLVVNLSAGGQDIYVNYELEEVDP